MTDPERDRRRVHRCGSSEDAGRQRVGQCSANRRHHQRQRTGCVAGDQPDPQSQRDHRRRSRRSTSAPHPKSSTTAGQQRCAKVGNVFLITFGRTFLQHGDPRHRPQRAFTQEARRHIRTRRAHHHGDPGRNGGLAAVDPRSPRATTVDFGQVAGATGSLWTPDRRAAASPTVHTTQILRPARRARPSPSAATPPTSLPRGRWRSANE